MPRSGAGFFLDPAVPAQRRYEALRAYLVDGQTAGEVAQRFGYTTATVRQMATQLRRGELEFFVSSKPGPKGPRIAHTIRDRVLELRAGDRSVVEIAEQLSRLGVDVIEAGFPIASEGETEAVKAIAATVRARSSSSHAP